MRAHVHCRCAAARTPTSIARCACSLCCCARAIRNWACRGWAASFSPAVRRPIWTTPNLANQHLLTARCGRCPLPLKGGVRRPVDYRNLDSEELGSIYESLLELHPEVNVAAGHLPAEPGRRVGTQDDGQPLHADAPGREPAGHGAGTSGGGPAGEGGGAVAQRRRAYARKSCANCRRTHSCRSRCWTPRRVPATC